MADKSEPGEIAAAAAHNKKYTAPRALPSRSLAPARSRIWQSAPNPKSEKRRT
jgi:hypothetical protein